VTVRRLTALICSSILLASLSVASVAPSAEAKPKITLTIFAASSLSSSFTKIGTLFQRDNPGVALKFSFLASSVLASQIADGAPADVFAAASNSDMQGVKDQTSKSRIFATNTIVLAYPRGRKGPVTTFSDLNKKDVKWLQCAAAVACGVATNAALQSLGKVKTKPVSYEPKVASVVSKLLDGEVDAAFIYHSDYISNKDLLREVAFPDPRSASTNYPIAILRESRHSLESQKFVTEVFSNRSRKILMNAGFGKVL